MFKTFRCALATAGAVLALACATAHAAYPDKPIRIVVPQPAGGFNDLVARLLSRKLGDAWGQPVVVENIPGAGSQLGTTAAARAPADGYTLLIASFAYGTNPSLRKNMPYDTARDFRPVIQLGRTPNILVVAANSPHKSLQDVIAYAKAHPGKLSYASSGAGSSPHLSMEMLKDMAGIDLVHVPYKGAAPMSTDLMGGQVDIMFENTPNQMPFVTSGKMRALAVTSPAPTPFAPGVPTVASAVPNYQMQAWFGVVVRSGVPDAVVAQLNAEIQKILAMPDVRQTFAQASVEPVGGSAAQFGAFLQEETAKWAQVIKAANISLD